jgi:hypothetical protein
MNKVPLVINLFGAPGAGKSTGAAYIFSELKQRGVNAELVTEFAKDKTWEGNLLALSCQEYVFGKQSYRLARCRDDVDVIVTDSPLPLAIIYNTNPALGRPFNQVILNVFDTYDNVNFFIKRGKAYNPKGRNQTEAESDALAEDILHMLDYHRIDYGIVEGNIDGYEYILDRAFVKLASKGVNIY